MSNVQRIIQLEKDGDLYESQSNECRWEAAKLISEELASGKNQVTLASEIGKSQGHVSKCKRIWEGYENYSPANKPLWADAYREVDGKSDRPDPIPQPSPDPTPVPEPEVFDRPDIPDDVEPCPTDTWGATFKQLEMLLGNYVREAPPSELSNVATLFRKMADKADRKARTP